MIDQEKVQWLLEALGGAEEPLGIYYSAEPPQEGLSPKSGSGHACLIGYVRMARKRHTPVWFSAEAPGCPGGWVYLGYILPPPERIAHFVTTGLPGMEGERYMPRPESMHRLFAELDIQPAPAPYCVIKPLSLFTAEEEPLLVSFTARGELLGGLVQLAYFAFDDHNAVAMPFGAGCTGLVTWPLHYLHKGLTKAVVGGSDPSCRPFMGVDELFFTVSRQGFERLLEAGPQSFLTTGTWAKVQKRIAQSRNAWHAADQKGVSQG